MGGVLGVVAAIFWGAVLLSLIVFVHEGGHFLAARACGVRVTEFFLGFPCRFNLHHVSRRIGTKFGVTPVLIGGYAMIAGMEQIDEELAPRTLSEIHRAGRISTHELAERLGVDEEQALAACVSLMGWGSVAGWYDVENGERPDGKYYPTTYESMPRDAGGATLYDGRIFDRASATAQGEPWEPTMGERAFFEQERSRTYLGKGFLKRAFMLVAGIAVNIATGFLLMVAVYSVIGFDVALDVNTIGSVTEGSAAAEAGLAPGDSIVEVAGEKTGTWSEIVARIDEVSSEGSFQIVFEHEGDRRAAEVELDEDGLLGIGAYTTTVRLSPLEAAGVTASYIAQTAQSVAQLLVPAQTMEILNNSTSEVGIAVMIAQAAAAGPAMFLSLAALISFSLGFMNLLPSPPLDGGKLLIEVVQAVIRRPVPTRVQTGLSLAGFALLMVLVVYMLRLDVLRFL